MRFDKPHIINMGPWERGWPWTPDTIGVGESHFGVMVTTVAVFTARYVLRSKKQFGIKNQLINTDYYQMLLINIYSY
jgi:hypothetical protein